MFPGKCIAEFVEQKEIYLTYCKVLVNHSGFARILHTEFEIHQLALTIGAHDVTCANVAMYDAHGLKYLQRCKLLAAQAIRRREERNFTSICTHHGLVHLSKRFQFIDPQS